jgi:hypothetical protein
METFEIPVRFVYNGVFEIKADNLQEAMDNVIHNYGMCGCNIHSTLNNDRVDWEFPTHPDKEICVSDAIELNAVVKG